MYKVFTHTYMHTFSTYTYICMYILGYQIGISDCDVSNCCWKNLFGFRSAEECSLVTRVLQQIKNSLYQTAFLNAPKSKQIIPITYILGYTNYNCSMYMCISIHESLHTNIHTNVTTSVHPPLCPGNEPRQYPSRVQAVAHQLPLTSLPSLCPTKWSQDDQ